MEKLLAHIDGWVPGSRPRRGKHCSRELSGLAHNSGRWRAGRFRESVSWRATDRAVVHGIFPKLFEALSCGVGGIPWLRTGIRERGHRESGVHRQRRPGGNGSGAQP